MRAHHGFPSPCRMAILALVLLALTTPANSEYLGDSDSEVHEFGYCDGPVVGQPIPHIAIEVVGLGTAISDADGNWSIAGGGGSRMLHSILEGPYVHVYENLAGPVASFSAVIQEGVPFTVRFADFNAQQDERNVFDAVNDVHDFIARFDPDFGYINQQVRARVSIDLSCGAFWDGELHFYRGNPSCVNTGELEQIVHHEYGHGVQDFILGGWQGNEGLGEGNADFLGNVMTLDSAIARGLFPNDCEAGVRDSDNDLVYPDDVIGQDPYTAGSVIAGFHWDTLVGLRARYGAEPGRELAGKLWHFARVLSQPVNQPDQVLATFVADDDDGNMLNGTPNFDILCEAAAHHGFECPEIDLTAVAAGDAVMQHVQLDQNVPNPFNPHTEIRFRLDSPGRARLAIYDIGGRLLRLLVDEDLGIGDHRRVWDGLDADARPVSSGIYLYRLDSVSGSVSRKLTLLR